MSVLVIRGWKCIRCHLVSHVEYAQRALLKLEPRRDRQTDERSDGHQTETLRFPLNAASVLTYRRHDCHNDVSSAFTFRTLRARQSSYITTPSIQQLETLPSLVRRDNTSVMVYHYTGSYRQISYVNEVFHYVSVHQRERGVFN